MKLKRGTKKDHRLTWYAFDLMIASLGAGTVPDGPFAALMA
ncbi:MAG: hypothetical protein ACM34I_02730 [bacterium]